MSTFPWKKIEILMTSDISTTENAENGGLGHIPYFIIHERLPTKFIYMCTSHIIEDSANDMREITRTYLR